VQKSTRTREQDEAAEWLARLGNHSITTETVREFRAWRDNPANDAAYQEAEAIWEASGKHAADPEIMRMTEAALARGRGRPRSTWLRRGRLAWGLVAAALLVLALGVTVQLVHPPIYETGPGELRVVRLADGSRLHLNVDSRAQIEFSPKQRLIRLRGEAFFDVAHDAGRPFVVEARGVRVRALGTKFDVHDEGDRLQITLLEGRVQVQRREAPQAWTLAPNQRLVLLGKGPATPTAVDATRTTSWTTGRLNFHETPLAEAVTEVNRYGKAKIVLEGDALRRRPVTGYFDVGDTDSFVKGVSAVFDLQATTTAEGLITLRERAATGA
jgi:transmembrane sensor